MKVVNPMGTIHPRIVAAANQQKRYQGKPCPICGKRTRYTSSGQCAQCSIKKRTQKIDALRHALAKVFA